MQLRPEATPKQPVYWQNPIRWARFWAHHRPHLFVAAAVGVIGPVLVFTVTPIRRKFLYEDHAPLPKTYPIPKRARDTSLAGFEDA